MPKFAKGSNSGNIWRNLFKSYSGNLLIIPYQLTKFQAPPLTTVMILSFRTDMLGQTVQTQIEEQSDQGLHCLPFRLHRFDSLLYGRAT